MEGEWDSSRLARTMQENTFRAEFFVPNNSEFPDFCQGREGTSAQLFGKHTDILGAMMLRSGG